MAWLRQWWGVALSMTLAACGMLGWLLTGPGSHLVDSMVELSTEETSSAIERLTEIEGVAVAAVAAADRAASAAESVAEAAQANAAAIEANTAAIQRALGEDGVVSVLPGRSFVREPVRVCALDELICPPVGVTLVLRRTSIGNGCRFTGGTSTFRDETGLPAPGGEIAVVRQATTERETFQFFVDQPRQIALKPGRITLELHLDYDCGGEPVSQTLAPLVFRGVREG